MGRFDKYLEEPAAAPATGGRFAKYLDTEPVAAPAPVQLNTNGLPMDFVGPPSVQDDPKLKTVLPSIQLANEARSAGRTVRSIDPKTGNVALEPLPGNEVRSVLSHKGDKDPEDRKKPDEVQTWREQQDAQSRPVYDPYGPLKAFGTSAVESASFGFDDEYGALLMDGNYDNNVDTLRRAKKIEQAKDPQMSTAGSIFGGALVPVGGIGGGALRTIATGTGVGAVSALGASEKRLTGPNRDITGALIDTAKGAGMGLVGGGLIAGGKATKNFLTTTPERIATRKDNDRFNAITRKLTPTQHEEMLGRLAEKKPELLSMVSGDPDLDAAVMRLASDKTEESARAAAAIADARAGAAALADSRTRNLLAREAGPIEWQDISTPLTREAERRAASLVPSVNKTGDEIAGIAEKVRERHMPVEGEALLARVAKDVDPATLARIDRDPESYAQVLTKAKAGKVVDNPSKVVEKLTKYEETILAKTDPIRKAAGNVTLRELSATITKAAQEASTKNPAEFIVTGVDANKNAQPLISRLWKTYAPEHVDEFGNITYQPPSVKPVVTTKPLDWREEDPSKFVTSKQWYHGTSDESGIDPGDWMDPSKGRAENAVWATPDIKQAQYFSKLQADADGGNPVIFKVKIPEHVKVEHAIDDVNANRYSGTAPTKYTSDAHAILDDDNGGPALAIIKRGIAKIDDELDADDIAALLKIRNTPALPPISARPIVEPLISVDAARRLVSKMQSNVFNENPLGETAADRMRKSVAMAAKEKVDEMVARNLSPKKAAEFAELNRQESRIISLRDGLEAKAIKARRAEVPPQEFPRTGKIDPREVMNAAKEAKSPEAQELLGKIVESHMGKGRMTAIKAAEERAKLSGELADALAGRVRETAGGRKPGIREIKNESLEDASTALKIGGLTTAMASPLVGTAMVAGALGMRTSRDQIARSIDKGIAAMANAAKMGASPKVLARIGQLAGFGSELTGDVVNILSTRTYPGRIDKED